MCKKECTRLWVSESLMAWKCHSRSCVFCDNCTDIWYDLNGPYMVHCDKNYPEEIGCKGQCKHFIEENPEIITEEEYSKKVKNVQDFFENNKELIEKMNKSMLDYLFGDLPR